MTFLKNKWTYTFLLLGSVIVLNSCHKDFDESSYAPEKPFGGYTNSKDIATGNLVAYWAFNGNLTDSVGNLTGTNNGTTFVAGKKAQALQIGGSNYYLISNPGSVIPNLKAYTISFWMNAPQNTSFGYGILSLNNPADFWGSLDVYLDNGGGPDTAVFKVHMNNANAKNTGQFPGFKLGAAWDKWVHIAITYDSSQTASTNFNVYANGASVYSTLLKDTTNNYGPLKFPNPTAMVIGTWQFQTNPSLTTAATSQAWAGSFGGALDELRIYNKPLKSTDINSLFKLESVGR